MLWFNTNTFVNQIKGGIFKYISCYGSTLLAESIILLDALFKYISCYGSTKSRNKISSMMDEFKYISCYGSTPINY